MTSYKIAALYKFVTIEDPPALKAELESLGHAHDLVGTLLIADEGLNGTIAGSVENLDQFLEELRKDQRFADLAPKYSTSTESPFYRLKVRLKKEIVTMGVEGVNPNEQAGEYVAPEDWNALITRDDVVVVDTRNIYETSIGSFKGALDPKTITFRDFPKWAEGFKAGRDDNDETPKVAMFCTGGIRCEKATSYMKSIGFDEVFHLEGGILKYLEEVPEEESLYEGACFVFDERVSVEQGLKQGDHTLCRACRYPLEPHELTSEHYQEGVSCPHCHDKKSSEDKARFAERQRQIELAKLRGEKHIGTGKVKG